VLAKLVTVDGSGSGLDADLIDGIDSSELLKSNTVNANVQASQVTLGHGGVLDWGYCPSAATMLPVGFSPPTINNNDGFCVAPGAQGNDDNTLFIMTQDNGDAQEAVYIGSGNTCCGPDWRGLRVRGDGNAQLSGTLATGQGQLYADLAENVPVAPGVEAGDVVVASPDAKADYGIRFVLAREYADPAVVGVISDTGTLIMGQEKGRLPVALAGFVKVKVDADLGAISRGDLLTSSATPGHATRAREATAGTILGKALEPLAKGKGRVLMMVLAR
jgi:hypothetical protein